MATQVDSLNRGGQLKSFRPWRHRETTAGHGHVGEQDAHSVDSMDTDMPLPATMHTIHHQRSEANAARKRPSRSPPPHSPHHRPHSQHPLSTPPPSHHTPISSPLPSIEDKPDASSPSPLSPLPCPSPANKDISDDTTLDTATPRTVIPPVLELDALSRQTPLTDSLPPLPSSSRPSLKRRRPLSDVDGPNTADLCCKKRRLRRFLITSRLSQPFSQPATHILNRESVALGDKRFLKLAAIMNARRITRGPLAPGQNPHQPCPSEVLRRAAMANRLRQRIFSEAGSRLALRSGPAMAATTAPPTASGTTTAAEVASSAVFASNHPGQQYARVSWKPSFVKSSSGSTTSNIQLVRALSRSPKLRPVRDQTAVPPLEAPHKVEDDLDYNDDDDSEDCAFPTSEHETRYDANDDPEDVYADFSVLFNSAALAGNSEGDGDGELDGLDDYMDELDGIAHLPR